MGQAVNPELRITRNMFTSCDSWADPPSMQAIAVTAFCSTPFIWEFAVYKQG